jgi:hypothetical protein
MMLLLFNMSNTVVVVQGSQCAATLLLVKEVELLLLSS